MMPVFVTKSVIQYYLYDDYSSSYYLKIATVCDTKDHPIDRLFKKIYILIINYMILHFICCIPIDGSSLYPIY